MVHVPVLSFFSPGVYRDVAVRWRGTGMAYLLFVVALVMIPQAAATHVDLRNIVNQLAPAILPQLPTIFVKAGVVTVEPPGERTINDPRTGQPMLHIDTAREGTTLDADAPPMVLTGNALLLRRTDGEVQVVSLAAVDGLKLDAASVMATLQVMQALAVPVLYPLSVAVLFLAQLIKALLLAWVGRMYTSRMTAQLKFRVCLRLAMVALTPPLVVGSIMDALHVVVPLSFVVATVATFSYMMMGVASVYEEEPDEEDEGGLD